MSSKTLRSELQSELTPLVENLRTDWPFLVRGPAVVCDPTTAASVGELLKPHRTTRHLTSMEVGPTSARFDGRELDSTDN